MKNLFSSKKFITTIMVSVGLGFTSSSYALSLQNIYDVPEPGTMALTALGIVGLLASRLHKK